MYFFDTYAIIEIIRGNPSYSTFKKTWMATTRLNLMEVYYWLLNKFGKEDANQFYDEAVQYAVEVSDDIVKEAMAFRLDNKHRRLSYVDCIGYVIARANNMKFLTGDAQFEEMPNVEFIK